eukprot:753537-Hanusia_phi.AAC.1
MGKREYITAAMNCANVMHDSPSSNFSYFTQICYDNRKMVTTSPLKKARPASEPEAVPSGLGAGVRQRNL